MNLLPLILIGALPTIASDPEPSVLPVVVYAKFQHITPQAVLNAMPQEVSSIMTPVGVLVEWRSLDNIDLHEAWLRLMVVQFKGTCDTGDLSLYPPYPFVLARTHVTDGAIIPFSDIYCNAIRAVVALGLIPLEPEDRDSVFGRAVGRVLAHELYHILAATKHHGSRGVAERAYSVKDLFAEEFRFDSDQVRRLHKSLLSAFLQLAGALPRGTPPGLSIFIEKGCVSCHGVRGEGTPLGPVVRSMATSYDSAKLTIRLGDRGTLMHERAQRLGTLWPPPGKKDVEKLATFLRALQNGSTE